MHDLEFIAIDDTTVKNGKLNYEIFQKDPSLAQNGGSFIFGRGSELIDTNMNVKFA